MSLQDSGLFDGLSADQVRRTAMLDDLYISHPTAQLIQARAERLYREAKLTPGKPGAALMFVGDSGIGKSAALQLFHEMICDQEYQLKGVSKGERVDTDDLLFKSKYIPILYVNVPEAASLKDFYTEMLVCLGDQNPRGTVATMRPRLVQAIQNAGVGLIIIDELQHLVDTENDRVKRNVANAIKRLLDVLKLPIILAGMDAAKRIFGPTLETKRRTDWCYELGPYDARIDRDREAFLEFLANYDEALVERECFKRSSCLSDPTRAARIHYATRGAVGHVARLIKAAGTLAIESGASSINDTHLAEACDAIFLSSFGREIDVNPFRAKELPAAQHFLGSAPKPAARKRSAKQRDKEEELA